MSELLIEVSTPKKESFELDDDILSSDALSAMIDTFTPQTLDSPASTDGSQSQSPEPSPEKKPVKKRKSWGQELPTPTTNLPPRKRAKTEAEKEQRRIERVLRNRAAAQSSRERKRKEVEALEGQKNGLADENKQLIEQNARLQAMNIDLSSRIDSMRNQNKILEAQLRELQEEKAKERIPDFNPLLLTPPVDISHDIASPLFTDPSTPPRLTGSINPSHLLTPSKSQEDSFSLTQHTAVMLCDLPCQLMTGASSQVEAMLRIMQWTLLLTAAISSQAPLMEVIFYLVTKCPIPDSELPRLFPWIHMLITIKPTQRLRRRLLTISPACALLLDATNLAPWFEYPTNALDTARSIFSGDSMKKGRNPALAGKKLVAEHLGIGGIDYGPKEGKGGNFDTGAQFGKSGFDFNTLLSKGNG